MKKFVVVLLGGLSLALGSAEARGRGGGSRSYGGSGTGSSSRSHSVRGYSTKTGTYVAPHRRTNPNKTQRDNYGAKGNYNPSTGKTGTKPVEK